MVLKLIKHDEALEGLAGQLKEFFSTLTTEQHAYTTPWIEQGILKRLNDLAARLQNAVDEASTTVKQRMGSSKARLMWISK